MVSSKNVIMEEKLCVRWKKLTQRKKLKKICKKGRKKECDKLTVQSSLLAAGTYAVGLFLLLSLY